MLVKAPSPRARTPTAPRAAPAWEPRTARALTDFLRLRAVLYAAEDAGQAGLADAVFAQQDHLVEAAVRVAARGDDRVGGVGGPALPVRLAGAIRGAAHKARQLVLRQGGPQVPLVHRHAAPVQVLVCGERHAAAPLVQVAQLVAAVQSHGDAGLRTRRKEEPSEPRAPVPRRRGAPPIPPSLPRRSEGGQEGFPANAAAVAASPLFMAVPPGPPRRDALRAAACRRPWAAASAHGASARSEAARRGGGGEPGAGSPGGGRPPPVIPSLPPGGAAGALRDGKGGEPRVGGEPRLCPAPPGLYFPEAAPRGN